jgi:hypothetical protein
VSLSHCASRSRCSRAKPRMAAKLKSHSLELNPSGSVPIQSFAKAYDLENAGRKFAGDSVPANDACQDH